MNTHFLFVGPLRRMLCGVLWLCALTAGTAVGSELIDPAAPAAHRASTFLERKLVDRHNNDVGEIVDIIVDIESGRMNYVVIRLDDIARDGRVHVLPFSAFRVGSAQDAATVMFDRDVLSSLRSFPENNWPGFQETAYWENLNNSIPFFPELPAGPKHLVRMSRLLGEDVRNPQGEELGRIHDVVLGKDRILYAVLDYKPVPLTASKLFPYPMQHFSIPAHARGEDGQAQFLELDAQPRQLDRLEGLPQSEWPYARERS